MQSIKELFGRTYSPESGLCFILMPFRPTLNEIYQRVIKPTVESFGEDLTCVRADEVYSTKPIMGDIWEHIQKAEIIIADLTDRNPNVLYELGLCHALWKKVILLSQRLDDIPFDLKHFRIIIYEHTLEGADKLARDLRQAIVALRRAEKVAEQATPGQEEKTTYKPDSFAEALKKIKMWSDDDNEEIDKERRLIKLRNKMLSQESSGAYDVYVLQIDFMEKMRDVLKQYDVDSLHTDQESHLAMLWRSQQTGKAYHLVADEIVVANSHEETIFVFRHKAMVAKLIADTARDLLQNSDLHWVKTVKDSDISVSIDADDAWEEQIEINTSDAYAYGVMEPGYKPVLISIKKPRERVRSK